MTDRPVEKVSGRDEVGGQPKPESRDVEKKDGSSLDTLSPHSSLQQCMIIASFVSRTFRDALPRILSKLLELISPIIHHSIQLHHSFIVHQKIEGRVSLSHSNAGHLSEAEPAARSGSMIRQHFCESATTNWRITGCCTCRMRSGVG